MSKLKIAHLICDLGPGGGQRSTIDLINATNDIYDNKLILLENIREYEPENIDISYVCKKKKIYKKLGTFGDYLLSKKLKKILTDKKIDIVISHMEVTAKVLHYVKLPKIFYMRVDITQELQSLKDKSTFRYIARENLYKKIFTDQHLITISEDTKKNIEVFINTKSIETIYNPFDKEKILKNAKEKSESLNDNYIIQVGSGVKRKRQDVLLEAFTQISNKSIKLLLLGTSKNEEIIKLMKKFDIDENRVLFIPFTQNPYPYIKNAKLLVMCSEREGLPRVIVESLILDTPVVSTDCDTGPREILVDELKSYLSEINDSNTLARNIDRALNTYPKIKERYTLKFNKDKIKEKYIKYIEVLSDRKVTL